MAVHPLLAQHILSQEQQVPIPSMTSADPALTPARFKTQFLRWQQPALVHGETLQWPLQHRERWLWHRLPSSFVKVPGFGDWWADATCGASFVEEAFFHLHPEIMRDFSPPAYFDHADGSHKDGGDRSTPPPHTPSHQPPISHSTDHTLSPPTYHPSLPHTATPLSRDDIAALFGRRNLASYSRFAVFSHAGGGTQLHKDAWDFGFWNTCVYGLKRWLIFPDMDKRTAALIGDLNTQVRIDPHTWFDTVYPLLREHNIPHFDFMQGDGDMVFVPGGWYHQVISLTNSSSVSYNLFDRHSFKTVTQSMCQRHATNPPSTDAVAEVDTGAAEDPTDRLQASADTAARVVQSKRACRLVSELRPSWYRQSCCPQYLSDPQSEKWPLASRLQDYMVFPREHVEYD
jgi:hypothetical protein